MVEVILADIETDGLTPSKIHFVRIKRLSDGLTRTIFDTNDFRDFVKVNKGAKWVFHYGLGFDVWVINRLVEPNLIDPKDVIDTYVVSKLVDYNAYNTHSLAELGESLGVSKDVYDGGWDTCTPDMVKYGEQDVVVLEAVWNKFKKFIYDPKWAKAMRVEHDIAIVCNDMQVNGFKYNFEESVKVLAEVTKDMDEIESRFSVSFPPKRVVVKELKYRKKIDGTLPASLLKAMEDFPDHEVVEDSLLCYGLEPFNPASSKQRIDVLWEAGWKPTEKTKGHKKFIRGNKKW